jgi:hypothetical protein
MSFEAILSTITFGSPGTLINKITDEKERSNVLYTGVVNGVIAVVTEADDRQFHDENVFKFIPTIYSGLINGLQQTCIILARTTNKALVATLTSVEVVSFDSLTRSDYDVTVNDKMFVVDENTYQDLLTLLGA